MFSFLSIFSNPLIIIIASASLIIVTAVFVIRGFLHRLSQIKANFKQTVLQIRLPKESAEVEQEKEQNKKQGGIKEEIAIAETLYANLYGLRQEHPLRDFFLGNQNYLSLEMVAERGLIKFFLICSKGNEERIEQQIHAQYPYAEIDRIADYNIFTETGEVKADYLLFKKKNYLPLKTYQEQETDPMNALTNTLSKLDVKEGAAIQILIQPAKSAWARRGAEIARKMQQGKKLGAAQSSGFNLGSVIDKAGEVFEYGGLLPKSGNNNLDDKNSSIYKLTPMEEEVVKGIENKIAKFAFEANIRIISSSEIPGRAQLNLENILNSFAQYDNSSRGNGFKFFRTNLKKIISDFIFRNFKKKYKIILNTQELTSLWHFPLPSTETPNILWLSAKKAAPPVNLPSEGIILGKSLFRGQEKIVRIKRDDRRRHMYIIGKSGSGKSVLLCNMAIQDIENGDGVGVLDPHGELIESILENIPQNRVDDIVYFNPADMSRPLGLNMLEYKTEEQMDFAVQEMIAIFYKLFPPEMIGPMFEHNMRNVMLTLMADKESPGTIADIPRMFTDKEFQQYKLKFVKDPVVRSFWEKEMAQTTDFHKSEMLGYLISKVGRFVENEMMRNIIGQPQSGFDFREIMDKKKILLINLSKGKTGEVNSSLLGLIVVAKLQMAALSRADLPSEQRHDFYLYIDEFQNFITDSIATILSEARKYKLNLILAHQYLGQLIDEKGQKKILDAVLGNAGTIGVFRIGVEDAETIAKELAPIFNQYDVINIDKFNLYLKLLIDGTAARAFNIITFPPSPGNFDLAQSIKELARLKYGRDRKEIEQEILERTKLGSSMKDLDLSKIEASL